MAIFKATSAKNDFKRSGNGGGRSGDGIYRLQYKPGDNIRLTFPVLKGEDGKPMLVMLGEVQHRVQKGFLKGTKRDGSKYNLFAIRCLNVLSQPDVAVQHELIHDHRFCPICQLNRWEMRRQREQMPENFGDLSKEDQKAFYQANDKLNKVSSSSLKNSDGSYRPDVSLYALALQFEVQEDEETTSNGRKRRIQTPVLDEEGNPTYKPVLVPVSSTRLDNMDMAINTAIDTGILADENVHSFSEGEDADGNEEVNTMGWIDFLWQFPDGMTKMESGKKLLITVTPDTKSLISKELITKVVGDSEGLIKKANDSFYQMQPTMKELSLEDYFSYMADGGEYYREMEAKYSYTDANTPEGELTDEQQYVEAPAMVIEDGKSWDEAKNTLLKGATPVSEPANTPAKPAPVAEPAPKAEPTPAPAPKAEPAPAPVAEPAVEEVADDVDGFDWD